MTERKVDIRKLFNEIDKAKLGFLDEKQLSNSVFTRFDRQTARKLVFECDQTQDGKVTFNEFKEFIDRKEEELRKLYEKLRGDSQKLRVLQLKSSIQDAGRDICYADAMCNTMRNTIRYDKNSLTPRDKHI
jgi:solute carrier family 25 phosphate transporter 23/24/25/41